LQETALNLPGSCEYINSFQLPFLAQQGTPNYSGSTIYAAELLVMYAIYFAIAYVLDKGRAEFFAGLSLFFRLLRVLSQGQKRLMSP
jgi:hypothetical protein